MRDQWGMSNVLKVSLQATIYSLHDRGWSRRRIARELLSQETQASEGRLLKKYLKPDLLIIDDMGLKILPQKSGEILLEIIMRRYENRSTIVTLHESRRLGEYEPVCCTTLGDRQRNCT
jgi:IstB-like ATP binding protein